MQGPQFPAGSILEWGRIKNRLDMSLVDQSWAVVSRFQALYCFFVILTRLGEAIH